MSRQNIKERLYEIMFEADTPAGKLFDVLLFIAIMFSVALTMLASVQSIRDSHGVWLLPLNAAFMTITTP